jgi:hypothetical protein
MSYKSLMWTSFAALGLCLTAGQAEARGRNNRDGINFGATFRVLDAADRTSGEDELGRNTRSDSSSTMVNPYLGYSFGAINLGIMYSAEARTSETVEDSADGATTTTRHSTQSGKGASLYARFQFAYVFFFEGGGGLYQDKLKVRTETKEHGEDGSFTGAEDEYEVKGVGPGYHVAGGIELPMAAGFYFTTAYQMRMVQLRDHDGGNNLGSKRSQNQKREVLFGIAYYDN